MVSRMKTYLYYIYKNIIINRDLSSFWKGNLLYCHSIVKQFLMGFCMKDLKGVWAGVYY
jgi:hypothetical protein